MVRFDPTPDRRLLKGQLIWFLIWVAVTTIGLFLTPKPEGHGTHTELGLPPCPSVLFLGRPCPGCGLTTSFSAIIHGNLPFAFHAHPFGPVLYLMFTASALACFYGWFTRHRFDTSSKAFNRTLGVFVIAFFAFGIARFAMLSHYGDHDVFHQWLVNRR